MFDRDRRESVFMVLGIVVVLAVCAVYYFTSDRESFSEPDHPIAPTGQQIAATKSSPPPGGQVGQQPSNLPKGISASINSGTSSFETAPKPTSKSSSLVPPDMLSGGH